MKQSKRLQPICDFKQREEDEAAKQLGKISQEVLQQKQRLLDLDSYRSDYEKQFALNSSLGINAKRMKEYHNFMNNLEQVLVQQKAAIDALELDCDLKKRQWLAARNRKKALSKVQANYKKEEDIQVEKKEQKEQDDRSIRMIKQ